MASKHTPAGRQLINNLPTGVVMAFRSSVRVDPLLVMKNIAVNCVEYLTTELPFIIPIPKLPTALVIDSHHPNYVCARVDPRLLKVSRRNLDPASCDALFAAQRQTRREEGTTAERKAAKSAQVVRDQKCSAIDANGVKCKGMPFLKSKNQASLHSSEYPVVDGNTIPDGYVEVDVVLDNKKDCCGEAQAWEGPPRPLFIPDVPTGEPVQPTIIIPPEIPPSP
ncbi:hypothetical protein DFH09DRAFT_1316600 [Mycena vulgaris]|nr:hypothetical protein DFH09DRAFT_1316600 [Mycena vulgaris]